MGEFSEEELGSALRLLAVRFQGPEDLYRFWKIAGKSVFPGPKVEQCRPWDANLYLS